MPFFEGAYDFEITGGTFYDIQGNHNVYNNDMSNNVTGDNNRTEVHRNYMTQRDQVYNYANLGGQPSAQAGNLYFNGYPPAPPGVSPAPSSAASPGPLWTPYGHGPYNAFPPQFPGAPPHPAHPQSHPFPGYHPFYHPSQRFPPSAPSQQYTHNDRGTPHAHPEDSGQETDGEVSELAEELEQQHIRNPFEDARRRAASNDARTPN